MQAQMDIYKEFSELEIVMIEGIPFFPASQCAKTLGYSNPRKAILDHCQHVTKRDGVFSTTNQYGVTSKQKIRANYIPESDLYRLIARSKMPMAKKFESYIFDEIMPRLRQKGIYITREKKKEILAGCLRPLEEQEREWKETCKKYNIPYKSPSHIVTESEFKEEDFNENNLYNQYET